MGSDWIDNVDGEFRLLEPGIVEYRHYRGAHQTLANVESFIAQIPALAGDEQQVGLLVIIGGQAGQERSARQYLAHGEETAKVLRQAALVVNSAMSRVIGNAFMGLARTAYPLRLFTDRERALGWLREGGG